jgi:hypothetical protein
MKTKIFHSRVFWSSLVALCAAGALAAGQSWAGEIPGNQSLPFSNQGTPAGSFSQVRSADLAASGIDAGTVRELGRTDGLAVWSARGPKNETCYMTGPADSATADFGLVGCFSWTSEWRHAPLRCFSQQRDLWGGTRRSSRVLVSVKGRRIVRQFRAAKSAPLKAA